MSILVTGGAGFIGSHVCERLLSDGHSIVCLDNFDDTYDPSIKRRNIRSCLAHSGFELVRGDILDADLSDRILADQEVDCILHLAALAGVRPSLAMPAAYADVDVIGTVNLLEAAHRRGVERFVFGSSSSVYGARSDVPFSEEDPTDWQVSPYAASKKAAELFCYTYAKLYGISTTILRFFTVYGPRQRPEMAIHQFARLMLEGEPIPVYGDGNSKRDYTYVDDTVAGVCRAIERPFDFEIINLGSGRVVTLTEMVQTVSAALGVQPQLDEQPRQAGDVPVTCADLEKAKRLLGYSPNVRFEDGVRRFISWLLAGGG